MQRTLHKKILQISRFLVLPLLFLSLLFSIGTLVVPGSASAHVARAGVAAAPGYEQSWGKVIVVSLSKQWLNAYQNGQLVFRTPVLTGQPALPTPLGTYHVFRKLSPTTFYSPFPRKSRYWYPPTHINYALEWKAGGYFLHDSWWHTVYGAGTNREHYDPTYGWQEGSHGCVSMPLDAAAWLYKWAPIGTTVKIVP